MQAVDQYVIEHGAPPKTFADLVPQQLESLPLGLPRFALDADAFGRWYYRFELCSFAGMRDTLILRSEAQRGSQDVPFGQLSKQLGEWEIIHG